MSDATAGGGVQPVPRDMPDQQAVREPVEGRGGRRAPEAGPGAAASPDRDPATASTDDGTAGEEPESREDPERPAASGKPVPRDLQDQQANDEGDDRWDAAPGPGATGSGDRSADADEDEEVPDTDEAGTGPQGAPRGGSPNPAHPVPDEPAG